MIQALHVLGDQYSNLKFVILNQALLIGRVQIERILRNKNISVVQSWSQPCEFFVSERFNS